MEIQLAKNIETISPQLILKALKKVTEKLLKIVYGEAKKVVCVQGEKKQTEKLLFSSSSNCVITYDEINCDSVSAQDDFTLTKNKYH